MSEKRNILKINIWGAPNKLNPNRHPAGGFYWGPDHPKGTPKKHKSKFDKSKPKRLSPVPTRENKHIA